MATRTESALLASPASPASVAASGTVTSSPLTLGKSSGSASSGIINGAVIIGADAPTTSPTVTFSITTDNGTTYNPVVTYVVLMTANATFPYQFPVPPEVTGAQVVVTNGATNAITTWWQGETVVLP
jgi:hypothetical protein